MRWLTALTLLFIGMLLIVGSTSVHAYPDQQLTCQGDNVEVNVDRAVELLNNNTDAAPSVVASLISSNTTKVHIQNAEQQYYTVSVDNSLTVTDVTAGAPGNPDVIVTMDQTTACDIYTDENPIAAGLQAYEDQRITLEATNMIDKAKVFVAERAMDAASLFS